MIAGEKYNLVALGVGVALILGSTGCIASRKYVQTQAVAPLQGKVDALNKRTDDLDRHITEVDHQSEQGYSAANAKAEKAQQTADRAGQDAQAADQKAQGAQQTADKGVAMADRAQTQIDNIDNFQPMKSETVQFGFNKWNLTDDDQKKLQDLAQTLTPLKRYAVVIQGFTDTTGPKQYNVELSQRRADSVVRYLTVNDHIPLVRIHMIGLGEDQPVADNHTSAGRRENRRVEIQIMTPAQGEEAGPRASK